MQILEEFRGAISEGDEEQGIELATDLFDQIDARSEAERGVEQAARSIMIEGTASDESIQAADALTDALVAAEQARSSLAYLVIGLGRGRFDHESALETVDRVRNEHEVVESAVSDLRATPAFDELGPILMAYAVGQDLRVPKGTSETAPFKVENSGGSEASALSLSYESGIDVEGTPDHIGSLGSTETTTVDVTVPDTVPDGEFSVRILVQNNGETSASVVLPIIVLSKADYLGPTVDSLNELEELIVDLLGDRERSDRPFRRKIQTIRRDLQETHDELEAEEIGAREADKRIRRNVKRSKGLMGQINSLQDVPDGSRAALKSDVTEIRESLRQAMTAAI